MKIPRNITAWLSKSRLLLVRGLARLNLSQDIVFLVMASFVGLGAGYGAVLFHQAIALVQGTLFEQLYPALSPWHPYAIALLPVIGGLAVGVISVFVSPESRGHGVPDVIAAVIARGGYLKPSLIFSKAATAALSIGSGGGAGREGPIVLIGATIGSSVGQFFRLSSDQLRTLAAAGAAAGIAAIFNAPLGGVMFALEIVLGDFTVRAFSPIVVAAVLATAVSRSFLGDHPTFVSTDYHLVSNYELGFYLLLGILAGFVALYFSRVVFAVEDAFGRLRKIPKILLPALGGVGVGCLLIWYPTLAGFSYEINNQAILGSAEMSTLIAVVLLKPLAAGMTLGSGGSGGLFAPAIKAGAAFGGVVGILLHFLFPGFTASSGAYALVGMGALLAGTMHAPLTAILIVFEVSDTYEVILPIMFAAVSSTVVARLLMKESIYTLPLVRQGIEIGYGINLSIVHRISMADTILKHFTTIHPESPVRSIINLVETREQTVFPVVDDKNALLGVVRFQDIRPIIDDPSVWPALTAHDIMVQTLPMISDQDTLDTILKIFELADTDALPVVAHGDRRTVVGLIRHDDVLRRYRKEILLRARRA